MTSKIDCDAETRIKNRGLKSIKIGQGNGPLYVKRIVTADVK